MPFDLIIFFVTFMEIFFEKKQHFNLIGYLILIVCTFTMI